MELVLAAEARHEGSLRYAKLAWLFTRTVPYCIIEAFMYPAQLIQALQASQCIGI